MNVMSGIGNNRKYNFNVLATTFMLLNACSLRSALSPSEIKVIKFH